MRPQKLSVLYNENMARDRRRRLPDERAFRMSGAAPTVERDERDQRRALRAAAR
jgi:hypothetical protein